MENRGCAKGEDCFFCHHSPEMVGGDRPRKEHRECVKKAVQGAILQGWAEQILFIGYKPYVFINGFFQVLVKGGR